MKTLSVALLCLCLVAALQTWEINSLTARVAALEQVPEVSLVPPDTILVPVAVPVPVPSVVVQRTYCMNAT